MASASATRPAAQEGTVPMADAGTAAVSSQAPRYRTIVADPPWEYREGFATQSRTPGRWSGPVRTKSLPYEAMTLDAIAGLPVAEMAAADCRVFCWTTNRYLPAAFGVLEAWGFAYRQTLVWHKRDGNMGGSVAPCSAEFLLVAVRGRPERLTKMPSAVVSTAAPKQHSKKPDTFLDLIERASPGPYLEMFARRARFGWDYWGDESLGTADLPGEAA
jgi:N6-adenosine-specific RNA methylase IME4